MTIDWSQRGNDEPAATREVCVSITGLKLKARRHQLRFWWHAFWSFAQARKAEGNISTEARFMNGIHHTRTVWVDETAMRRYVSSRAHLQAMKAFADIAKPMGLGNVYSIQEKNRGYRIAVDLACSNGCLGEPYRLPAFEDCNESNKVLV